MGLVEQNGHFTEYGSGLRNGGDDSIALDDLEPSLDQDIEVPRRSALLDDERSRRHAPAITADAIFQNFAHLTHTPLPPRLGTAPVTVERK